MLKIRCRYCDQIVTMDMRTVDRLDRASKESGFDLFKRVACASCRGGQA